MPTNLLRNLPSVSELLESPPLKAVRQRVGHSVLVARVRGYLDDLLAQAQTTATEVVLPTAAELAQRIAQRILQREQTQLREVINATGILLHSGLGRAPLAEAALEEMISVARGYCSLELDLERAERCSRMRAVEGLLQELAGAEAAWVVNNGAAATMLSLAALAPGRPVLVSRGQLIAIEGFRLPDIIQASGAVLCEVGAINSTVVEDFRGAAAGAGAVLWVEPAAGGNAGDAATMHAADLAPLGSQYGIPVIHSLGVGALLDFGRYGLPHIPTVQDSLKAGADLVVFSGDKLLGGPQCGVILGKRQYVERIATHPRARAVQIDKLTLAALIGTLRLYRQSEQAAAEIPLLQLLTTSVDNLKNRAERLAPQVAACQCVAEAEPISEWASLDQALYSAHRLPTWCVAMKPAGGWSMDRLTGALRTGAPAVVGRQQGDRLLFDLRTVFPRQDQQLVESLAAITAEKT